MELTIAGTFSTSRRLTLAAAPLDTTRGARRSRRRNFRRQKQAPVNPTLLPGSPLLRRGRRAPARGGVGMRPLEVECIRARHPCSADFPVCCIAGFQTRGRSDHPQRLGWSHAPEISLPLPIWKSAIQQVWKPALRGRCADAPVGRAATRLLSLIVLGIGLLASGCRTLAPGTPLARAGDEIIVAGQLFHTGTPVVTWLDAGGYDAYRVERRFSAEGEASWEASKAAVKGLASPNRYNSRRDALEPERAAGVRGGGWELETLREVVDQFVVHFDACGTSRQCFKVLHDVRGLSVHFLLDLDGTIYQTLDVKERAWHATSSNTRSVGIEIANIGAYAPGKEAVLDQWYQADGEGSTRVTVPAKLGEDGIRTAGFVARPARAERVRGAVQGQELVQYDFTPEQYAALTKLTATLCRVFPKLKCDYPRDGAGELVTRKLADEELARYQGVLGHFHIQQNKVDPGPAFDWEKVVGGARRMAR